MENESITQIPPLPQIGNRWHTIPMQPESVSVDDTWKPRISKLPVHAEKPFYNPTFPTGLPNAERSSLRTGELEFTNQGMTVRGVEVQPIKAFQLIGAFGFIGYILVRGIVAFVGTKYPALSSAGTYIWCIYIVSAIVTGVVNERKRGNTEFFLPWDAVLGAQIDQKGKWVSIVYTRFEEFRGDKVKNYYLPLSHLNVTAIHAVVATIQHYVPDAICMAVPRYHWSLGRKLLWLFFALAVVGMFVALVVATRQIPAPSSATPSYP